MTTSGVDPEYLGLAHRITRLESATPTGFTIRRFVYSGVSTNSNFYGTPQATTSDIVFTITSPSVQTGFIHLMGDARNGSGDTQALGVVALKLGTTIVGDLLYPTPAAWDPDMEGWGTYKFAIEAGGGTGLAISWPVTLAVGANTVTVLIAKGNAGPSWGLCSGGDQVLVSFVGYSGLTIVGSGAANIAEIV